MGVIKKWLEDNLKLLGLSIRLQLGRKFWIVPLLALSWPLFQAGRLLLSDAAQSFNEISVQNTLIGFPMTVIAIGLGVSIIAGEIERRTLEVAYTVPGGARRIWIAKLVAIIFLLLLTEMLLAAVTAVFFTAFPLAALYGAFQGAVFYLVVAMGLGALFKSEITAVLVALVILAANAVLLNLSNTPGHLSNRISPLFNPLALTDTNLSLVLAWTVQNRIGIALLIIGLAALAFARAEQRERLMGG